MSARSVVLHASTGTLTITPDPTGVGGWCQVHLLAAGTSRALGAERLAYIARRLLAFLRGPQTAGLRSVFSLAELHTSGYGEHVDGAALFRLQDANANWFASLVLTPDEQRRWLVELASHA